MPAVEYDDLSRGRKQEIDLARRTNAQKAKETAERGPGLKAKVSDMLVSSLPGGRLVGDGAQAARKQRDLDDSARRTQSLADYEDLKDGTLRLFEDKAASKEAGERARSKLRATRPTSVETEGMKKGGSVKGWGKARGARKAKVY